MLQFEPTRCAYDNELLVGQFIEVFDVYVDVVVDDVGGTAVTPFPIIDVTSVVVGRCTLFFGFHQGAPPPLSPRLALGASLCALVAAAQDSYRSQVMEFLNASAVIAVPEFGCTPLENAAQIAGNIAVIGRGTCPFAQKASIAQAAGAVAVVITDNRVAVLLKMVGDFSAVAIPAMMVTQDSGAKLRENSGRVATIGIGVPSAAMMSAMTL